MQETEKQSPPTPSTKSSESVEVPSHLIELLSNALQVANQKQNISVSIAGTETGFKAFKGTYDTLRSKANDDPDLARVYHALISMMDRSRGSEFSQQQATVLVKDILNLIEEFDDIAASRQAQFTMLILISIKTSHIEAKEFDQRRNNNRSNHRNDFKSNWKHRNNNPSNNNNNSNQSTDSKDPKVIAALKALGR